MTKKVVINDCYGGFGLSHIAKDKLLKAKGNKEVFWYVAELAAFEETEYVLTDVEDIEDSILLDTAPLTKYFGTSISSLDIERIRKEHSAHSSISDIERDDVDLVKVVEEMGEKASGRYSALKVVEIPKEVEFQIEEYDGNEWIAEKHRTWY